MASFVYNPFESDGFLDLTESQRQWNNYLQKREFHNDLKLTIESAGASYTDELRRTAQLAHSDMDAFRREFVGASESQLQAIREQTQAITESAAMICGSLEDGFAQLTSRVEGLTELLDWRLSVVEDQLKIANSFLRIPDFQKERQYFTEQGFKHYENARFNPELFEDALRNLLEAEKREPSDFLVLYRIGLILLYPIGNEGLSSLVKAEDYFRRAAKYAIVEANSDADRKRNMLASVDEQNSDSKTAREFAALSLFQAGASCYAQGKFSESFELSNEAGSLLPSLLEAGFLQAKSLVRLGEGEKAAKVARSVILKERFYAIKVATDLDLAVADDVRSMLQELRDESHASAELGLQTIRQNMLPDSQIGRYLPDLERLIQKRTYIDSLNALDKIEEGRSWTRPVFDGDVVGWSASTTPISIREFVSTEQTDRKRIHEFMLEIEHRKQRILDEQKRSAAEARRVTEAQMAGIRDRFRRRTVVELILACISGFSAVLSLVIYQVMENGIVRRLLGVLLTAAFFVSGIAILVALEEWRRFRNESQKLRMELHNMN